MKKIVGGKMYNTVAATMIADENIPLHNFYKTSEALYVTASGVFFLHGESSAGGPYGESDGRNSISGESIIPLSTADVIAWAERARITSEEHEAIAKLLNLPEA